MPTYPRSPLGAHEVLVLDAVDESDVRHASMGFEGRLDVLGLRTTDPEVRDYQGLVWDESLQFDRHLRQVFEDAPQRKLVHRARKLHHGRHTNGSSRRPITHAGGVPGSIGMAPHAVGDDLARDTGKGFVAARFERTW